MENLSQNDQQFNQFDQLNPMNWMQTVHLYSAEQIYETLSAHSGSIVRISRNVFSLSFQNIELTTLKELRSKLLAEFQKNLH